MAGRHAGPGCMRGVRECGSSVSHFCFSTKIQKGVAVFYCLLFLCAARPTRPRTIIHPAASQQGGKRGMKRGMGLAWVCMARRQPAGSGIWGAAKNKKAWTTSTQERRCPCLCHRCVLAAMPAACLFHLILKGPSYVTIDTTIGSGRYRHHVRSCALS